MLRVLRSSLLVSLLVVDVKDPSLNETMAKIKKNAGGFEPKEPPEHKTATKVGLHLDHLAVSAPPSARPARSTLSHPEAPSAHASAPPHTPFSTASTFQFPVRCADISSQHPAKCPATLVIECMPPLLLAGCHRWRRGDVGRLQHLREHRFVCILAF